MHQLKWRLATFFWKGQLMDIFSIPSQLFNCAAAVWKQPQEVCKCIPVTGCQKTFFSEFPDGSLSGASGAVTAVARVPAVAQVQPLTWEFLHAMGMAKKKIFILKKSLPSSGLKPSHSLCWTPEMNTWDVNPPKMKNKNQAISDITKIAGQIWETRAQWAEERSIRESRNLISNLSSAIY